MWLESRQCLTLDWGLSWLMRLKQLPAAHGESSYRRFPRNRRLARLVDGCYPAHSCGPWSSGKTMLANDWQDRLERMTQDTYP